jgi:hypothetical protein
MAAQVKVNDNSLWIKHIHGDSALREKLETLAQGDRVAVRVDGKSQVFEKMRNGPPGPTPGLKPVDGTKGAWGTLYRERRGELVEIALDDGGSSPPEMASPPAPAGWREASDAEREVAWQAFKALTKAGWRSDSAKGDKLDRDELHRR